MSGEAGGGRARVELHGRSCRCRGGSWAVLGEAAGSPCPGGDSSPAIVLELSEWRTLGKPADLEAYKEAAARVQAGERREYQRYEATLSITLARLPNWKTPNPQVEQTVTDVLARGGALVRSRMVVEKGEVLVFEAEGFKTRAEVTYVSAPGGGGDRHQRLGLRFLDAPLPDELIPAGAKPLA
ncbi:MAG TPA: PilZ domain-containing protein [Vicinamibacteria bacterium]|nr:PilZ domain-containing protein [Vicinamibacteria bacterium]